MTSDFKVICISNIVDGDVVDLVIGEVYEVVENPSYNYEVVYQIKTEHPDEMVFYHIELFKRMDEFRDDKLKELGI